MNDSATKPAPATPRNLQEVLRDEMIMRDRILALLADGPLTLPAIAEGLGKPAPEVMFWVMAMRRYGLVEEQGRPDDDGYFEYIAMKENA